MPKFFALLQVVHTIVTPPTVSDKMYSTCQCLHHILEDGAVSLAAGSDRILHLGLSHEGLNRELLRWSIS